jgi:hypothetical protein
VRRAIFRHLPLAACHFVAAFSVASNKAQAVKLEKITAKKYVTTCFNYNKYN